MTDVFISYSRRDKTFTQKLVEALQAANREVWADWASIPAASDWDAEIKEGIEKTNTVLFVLSPEWIKSNECRKELIHALQMGKRLVPILYLMPAQGQEVPPELARLNWVYMRDTDDFDQAFKTLCGAMDTDLDWIKTHTRLQVRAVEWKKKNGDKSFLLRGKDLTAGEKFLAGAATQSPAPTTLQSEYILASRKDATFRQRLTLAGVTTALVVSVVLGILAVIQWQEALKQANLSQSRALVVNTQLSDSQLVSNLLLSLTSFNLVKPYAYPERLVAEQSLRDSLSGESGMPLGGGQCPITNLTFSSDGRWLATGGKGQAACLWNAQDLTAAPILLQAGEVRSFNLIFSPDSQWLATAECTVGGGACMNNVIQAWNMQAPSAPPVILRGNANSGASHLAFIPGSNRVLISDYDTISIWDLAKPDAGYLALQQTDNIASLVVSRDGKWLVTGSWDKTTRLWDLQNLTAGASLLPGVGTVINDFAASADGQWLAAGGEDGKVYLWKTQSLSGEPVILAGNALPGKAAPQINVLAFSPDGRWLAAGVAGTLTLWDLQNQPQSISFDKLSGNITGIIFSPDSQWVSVLGGDSAIHLWSLLKPDNYQKPILLHGLDSLNSVAFSQDSRWLATAGDDGVARLWDLKSTDPELFLLQPFEAGIDTTLFSPDGRWLLARDWNKTARLWDRNNPATAPVIIEKIMSGAVFSPDGKWLAFNTCLQVDPSNPGGCEQGQANLQELANLSAAPKIILDHPANSFAFSPEGQWLVAGSEVLSLKDPTAQPVTLGGSYASLSSVGFSPDGQWLAGINKTSDKSVGLLWKTKDFSGVPAVLQGADLAQLKTAEIAEPGIRSLAFSPDSQSIATGECSQGMTFPIVCLSSTVKLWDVHDLSKTPTVREMDLSSDFEPNLTFSPDGRWLALGSLYDVYLWDTKDASKAPVSFSSSVGKNLISPPAFSPDNHWLAVGKSDGSILLANMDYLANDPLILRGHTDSVRTLAFSPDSQWLVTGSEDRTVRLWSMDTNRLVQLGCQLAGRNFTREEWKKYFPGQDYPARPGAATCSQWSLETPMTPAPTETPKEAAGGSHPPVETIPQEGTAAGTPPVEGGTPSQPPVEGAAPSTAGVKFFKEEFDTPAALNNWSTFSLGTGSDSNLVIRQEADHVFFDLGAKDLYVYYMYQPFEYRDAVLTMNAENVGRNNNNISLVCRMNADGTEWYEFSVESGGLWYLYAYDGSYTILANGGATTLKQGKEVNEYQLACVGNEITPSINGTALKTVNETAYGFRNGRVGFGVSSLNVLPITVNVNWFEVAQP